jgi:hypothetical protein
MTLEREGEAELEGNLEWITMKAQAVAYGMIIGHNRMKEDRIL